MNFPDVPERVSSRVRSICLKLPEVVETTTDVGSEFTIRRRTLAYLFAVEDREGRQIPMLVCRADPQERAVLINIGHPYFAPRSGKDRIGIVLEGTTDWTEIAELLTESYRLLAPKKLASLIELPPLS